MLKESEGIPINKSLTAYYYSLFADIELTETQHNSSNTLRDRDHIPMNKLLAEHDFKLSSRHGND
jgi:hypothetical protein